MEDVSYQPVKAHHSKRTFKVLQKFKLEFLTPCDHIYDHFMMQKKIKIIIISFFAVRADLH